MERFTVVLPVDASALEYEGRRDSVREHLNHRIYDEITKVLSDGQRHLFRVSYKERPEYGNITLCYLELEVGTVHIQQYDMRMPDYSNAPTWQVARSAIDEIKYRIRSRWRNFWGARK